MLGDDDPEREQENEKSILVVAGKTGGERVRKPRLASDS